MEIVAKFGGSSLADPKRVRNVLRIIQSNSEYEIVVMSAPGKRTPEDSKITDLLYTFYKGNLEEQINSFKQIRERFVSMVSELGLDIDIGSELDTLGEQFIREDEFRLFSEDQIVSRGEYYMARIAALALGWTFVDAADFIRLDEQSRYDARATRVAFAGLPVKTRIVIPGFYGSCLGNIKTFSRGGSDISGAIMAELSGARVYENWTDVDGVLSADPEIVRNTRSIPVMTYRELRELSYHGAKVLHEDTLFPVREAGIPVHVRNTNHPSHPGTWIVRELDPVKPRKGSVVGVAGAGGFLSFTLDKADMNPERAFLYRALGVLVAHDVSIDHVASSIATVSLVVNKNQFKNPAKIIEVQHHMMEVCKLTQLPRVDSVAIICVVGETMSQEHGVGAHTFTALHKEGINVSLIDLGSSEINLVIGVAECDCKRAINTIHHALQNMFHHMF